MSLSNIWCYTPEHDCQENKALRITPEGDSYWFCKKCFKDMGDVGHAKHFQFSNIRFASSPASEKQLKWLMDNRELIKSCMDAGLPIPRNGAWARKNEE